MAAARVARCVGIAGTGVLMVLAEPLLARDRPMPDWLTHVVTGVCTASFVAAVGGIYVRTLLVRHKARMEQDAAEASQRREGRVNEITVLHQSIDELRADRDALKKDLAEQRSYFETRANRRDKEINDLKSEHTACLVAMAEAKQSERWLTERIRTLEAEVAELKGTDSRRE